MKKILIIGTGGREHALGWNISQDKRVSKIFYLPAGEYFENIYGFIKKKEIDLTLIGSEEPLEKGVVDFLNSCGVHNVFGPTQEMAKIESDKFYSYDLMDELHIPQAHSIKCSSISDIEKAIQNFEEPVLKYRWLAKGKGVRVYPSQEEARNNLESFVREIGTEVLVAKRLHGQEFSVFGIADGENILHFEVAFQDHKPAYDGDLGPNTGGMGAYGPVPIAPKRLVKKISKEIMLPLVRKINYQGFLYAGMILTEEGPKVIEFNARFGDPEAQPAMMLLSSSLFVPIKYALEKRVSECSLTFKEGASCCVVLASKGYPGNYEIDLPISGIDKAMQIPGIRIFHSGTKFVGGRFVTNGGRVLGVTSYSIEGIKKAQELAYKAVQEIKIPGGFHYRKDIGDKAIS
jgi:phosphoribosylamine--glycine ligase